MNENGEMRKMKIEAQAYQVLEKTVKPGGNSGRVFVPKAWLGKRIKILLVEPLDE